MPLALIALLLAGELVTTAPPPAPAAPTSATPAPPPAASAPQGVAGVDLPSVPAPAKRPTFRDFTGQQGAPPSRAPGLGFGDPFGEQTPPPSAASQSSNDQGSRCRRTETANGFTYSCGDPETARRLEEETQRLLNNLLSPE